MGWVRRRCRATGAARGLPGSEGTEGHAGAGHDGTPTLWMPACPNDASDVLRVCTGWARRCGRRTCTGERRCGVAWRGLWWRVGGPPPVGRVVRLPGRTLRGAMARLCPDADKHARCAGVCAFTGRGVTSHGNKVLCTRHVAVGLVGMRGVSGVTLCPVRAACRCPSGATSLALLVGHAVWPCAAGPPPRRMPRRPATAFPDRPRAG